MREAFRRGPRGAAQVLSGTGIRRPRTALTEFPWAVVTRARVGGQDGARSITRFLQEA